MKIEKGTPCWIRWGHSQVTPDTWVYKPAFYQWAKLSQYGTLTIVVLMETGQLQTFGESLVWFTDPATNLVEDLETR